MIDKLDALLKRVSELLTVSSDSLNENSSVAFTALKAFTVKDIFRKEHSPKNTQLKQAFEVPNVLDTKNPDRLASYCKFYDYGAIKDDPLYQSVTFIAGLITTVISMSGVGLGISLGASIGMFAVNMALKVMEAKIPFYVTNFTFDIDKPSLDLADNRTGRWNNVIIQTRSKGGSVDLSDIIDAVLIAIGLKKEFLNTASTLFDFVDDINSILNGANSYIGGSELNPKIIPLLPFYYSQVTLYSEENPSMKYISTQMQQSAVTLGTQNVYQSVHKGNSYLVISPKFGSIKGACETWDPDIKKSRYRRGYKNNCC